jgi:rhodanese-related sulfurtransferase
MAFQYIEPLAIEVLRSKHPDVLMIDVRDHSDHAALCMPHSFCVPIADLDSDSFVSEHAGDASRPILLICQLGKRATMAAQAIENRVENPLFVLSGGLNACLEVGIELQSGNA